MKREKRGFTLVELMVCVAIIGILAAVAIPGFQRYRYKSLQSEAGVNMQAIVKGAISWFSEEHTDSVGGPMEAHFPHYQSPTVAIPATGANVWSSPRYYPDLTNSLPTHCNKYAKNAAVWNAEPWKSLKFSINKAHYFNYSTIAYYTTAYQNFTINASADLDCDATPGYFRLRVSYVNSTGDFTVDNVWQGPWAWADDV